MWRLLISWKRQKAYKVSEHVILLLHNYKVWLDSNKQIFFSQVVALLFYWPVLMKVYTYTKYFSDRLWIDLEFKKIKWNLNFILFYMPKVTDYVWQIVYILNNQKCMPNAFSNIFPYRFLFHSCLHNLKSWIP